MTLLSAILLLMQAAPLGTPEGTPQGGPPESPEAPAASEPLADQVTPIITPADELAEVRASGRFAAPLIPEGGHLVKAVGTLGRDEFLGVWTYELSDRLSGAANRSIVLLPSSTLGDMVGWHTAQGGHGAQGASPSFELSGLVLAFRKTNYIVGSFANPITRAAPAAHEIVTNVAPGSTPATTAAPVAAPAAAPAPSGVDAAPSAPVNPEDFAAELERRLAAQVPAVPTSSEPLPVAPEVTAAAPTLAANAPVAAHLLPPMRIQSRRGTLTRDPLTGTWRFVFASGHRDEGDIAMDLLPCSTLAAMIPQARAASQPPILLTGDIEVYEGRNYLRPVRFQVLSAGKGLGP